MVPDAIEVEPDWTFMKDNSHGLADRYSGGVLDCCLSVMADRLCTCDQDSRLYWFCLYLTPV